MKKKVKFNEKIALEVFRILGDAWQKKKGIFSKFVLPEDSLNEKEGWGRLTERERANFFFYLSFSMRGGITTEKVINDFWRLRIMFPELFEPEKVIRDWSPKKIKKTLNKARVVFKDEEHSENWYKNSKKLKMWGNDIRNAFSRISDFQEMLRKTDYKQENNYFHGMGKKILVLLTTYLQKSNLIPEFPIPISIDFHALRILWATEIIDLEEWARPFVPKEKHPKQLEGKMSVSLWYAVLDQIMIWSLNFLKKHQIPHLAIKFSLFILSRNLCRYNYQNSAPKRGMKYVEANRFLEDPNSWPKNYKDPCNFCFIKNYCKWAIPSAPYYKWGLLVRIGRRMPCPLLLLPGLELPLKPLNKNRGAS